MLRSPLFVPGNKANMLEKALGLKPDAFAPDMEDSVPAAEKANARETIHINERLPELAGWLPVSPSGRTIYPNGSPRDVFLHVAPERKAEALALLSRELDGAALVLPMERALELGLFGPHPVSAELRRRLGDILVLPRLGHFIWWREKGIMANHFHGHHGGLTAEEMTTALGAIDAL